MRARAAAVAVLLLVPACSVYRDQAEGAANIRQLASRVPSASSEHDRRALASGIDVEAAAIHSTLDPEAVPTIRPADTVGQAVDEAHRHASAMRTPMGQAWDLWGSPVVSMVTGALGCGALGTTVAGAVAWLRKRKRRQAAATCPTDKGKS